MHDPQSPEPAITTSHCPVISRIISSGAGTDAERFLRLMILFTP